jgi:hypothetical protein
MGFSHQFKPAHKEIKRYYEELEEYKTHEVAHEGATSSAFQNLLAATCKKADWHLVPQQETRNDLEKSTSSLGVFLGPF